MRLVLAVMILAACGGDDGADVTDAGVGQTIGPDGGQVSAPGGPTLEIPAGALDAPTVITIRATTLEVAGARTPVYEFLPSGLSFALPATVTFPLASTFATRVFWSTGVEGSYTVQPTMIGAASISATVTHFSTGYVGEFDTEGAYAGYFVDALVMPRDNTQARDYAVDVNGDGTVDNQLGMVLASFATMGLDLVGPTARAVDRGEILIMFGVRAQNFVTSPAMVDMRAGVEPSPLPCTDGADTVCRKHLDGSGSAPAASQPNLGPLDATITNGTLLTQNGTTFLQLAFSASRPPIVLPLLGGRVKATVSSTALTAGVIGGAVPMSVVSTTLIPELAASFDATVATTCTQLGSPPSCGCASGSTGANLISLFDLDHDCAVVAAEVADSSLVQSLFAADVTIEGQAALSVGVRFTAVPGIIAVPI